MKDPCRVCSARLAGSQCRWIFSSSAQKKLQVVLSHVLGWEVTRDGRGEFLCGKCVFQLEKVVQCDVKINQLQEDHNIQMQKLQAEKGHLTQCIVHVYQKNNPSLDKSDGETPPRSCGVGSPDEGQQLGEIRRGHLKNCMRRCVSLDRIVSRGTTFGRSSLRSNRLGSGAGLDGSMKRFGLRGPRHRSQSMYFDLIQHKGVLPRPGFKALSASLQSLNQDFSLDPSPDPPQKFTEAKVFVARRDGATADLGGKVQAKALLRSSPSQPSVISDLIQLLRCISKQQVSAPAGSHIPVLKRLSTGHLKPGAERRHREAEWKSLHELTEEFDDEYTSVSVEVVPFSNSSLANHCGTGNELLQTRQLFLLNILANINSMSLSSVCVLPGFAEKSEVSRLESVNKHLNEELTLTKSTSENLSKTLEDTQNQYKTLSGKLEEKENELGSEKKNALKRDKTIQGLTQVLREKEKEIAELCHEIEDRDDALAKAREVAHKAQLQKYQGAEEHQSLLMAKQTELAQLQGEHHGKVLEAQKLQRALDRKEQELGDLQQAKDQLEVELEDLQQQKKKGDKALNDLNNQLKKLSGEIGEREIALEQQYQELLDQTNRKLQTHEEYINMVRDFEQSRSPGGNDTVLSKLRQRLKEKEKALEQALDEKFAAIEEKDDEIHQLQLSLREKERDLDRLNNLLSHNEETINSFDSLIKEKDVELQHLANTLKNLQRAKQDVEDNLNRSLKEKDSIISQLQLSLEGKTTDMEEMAKSMLSQSETHAHDLAEQMGQRLKVTEAMLAEAVKARERLVADNESAVEGLLATISSKDQLLKESAEHYNRMLSERTQEIQELRKQLSDRQQLLATAEKQSSIKVQEDCLETANLRALIAEKDSLVTKLLQHGQERDHFLAEMRQKEEQDHVLELRQTIQIMQEKLDEREAELSRRNSEDNVENIPQSKKTVVILKKELTQKTEALNRALKRENELKISVAELQSLLSELEGRIEGQAINIESLTATLKTKDEIINVLHQRLGLRGESEGDHTQDQVIVSGIERSFPRLPQRERTMIGGDSQQESLPNLVALQQEHDTLNKALRAEQQLYSSLVRSVKEQDSAQRLHALQLELTAVQLLRQKLEESIKTNEELRDDLEREIHRAKLREGMDLIDPKELESMRHQLEDAQRWNASLQARLGAIQSRGGGVGGATDGGDTLSFIGDQTSYMSICFGEEQDDSLSQLSPQELKQKAGVKSRLPVPVRLRVEASSSRQSVRPEHLRPEALQHLNSDDVYGSDQQLRADSDSPISLQQSSPSSSTVGYEQHEADSALFTQLELLHQECQEKEALINKLSEQLADWEELHAQLKEKELLNHQYVEALQAAESTIAYLTACSLDSQGGFGSHTSSGAGSVSVGADAALHSRCVELQKALQDKEEFNDQLIELLNMAEKAITSSDSQAKNPEISDLCLKIEDALQQVKSCSKREGPRDVSGSTDDSMQGLQRHIDSLQEALWEQNRLNAELREQLRDAAAQQSHNSAGQEGKCSRQRTAEKGSEEHHGDSSVNSINQGITKSLMNCLSATESAIASLAEHCTNPGSFTSAISSQISTDLQINLDKLQRALQEREELCESTQPATKSCSNLSTASCGAKGQLPRDLHQNLCLLYKVFADLSHRIPELQTSLQEERGRREEGEAHRTAQDCKGLPPNVQVQLETLHKALREKKKACKNLEEKLATALTETSSAETVRKALEQDDKGVQVDLQDLGYETSGKSENDREESSSTDLEVGVNPSCSASSLPSLLKHEQATFSSTENLDSTSSTSYPSSPALSSAKVSLKSLQVYDEYGVSEDPLQLQAQVRELKVQLENQTKLVLQMQNLLRRNSLSSDHVANTSDPSVVIKDQEGTRKLSQDRSYRTGQQREKKEGENQAMRDKTIRLNMEQERERTLNRSTTEKLPQTRSRSTSPARLDSLVQSQARELSQLRQQIKESRGLGALQRRQLEELSKAFKDLLQASEVDFYMGEVVKEQLEGSLSLLDRLEGRLDKGESHLDNEDVAALELSRSITDVGSEESMPDHPNSPARIQQELDHLRLELEGERELLQQSVSVLVQHNLTLAECTREQLDLFAKELQEKNRLIQSLQNQFRGQSSSSHHSSHSDLYHSDRTSSSCHSPHSGSRAQSGAQVDSVSSHRLQGLQEQLRSSEELNTTLRSELDLHQSIMAQSSSHHQKPDQGQDQERSGPRTDGHKVDGDAAAKNAAEQPRTMNSDLLAEHLQEIRALRHRLEESIRTNDRLREQLEKRLAEVEKDPATNIFIHGNEEQGHLANEVRFLWGQNQALKEQLNLGSRDKQKENEKLRETLARRTAKLEQSRKESEALRQENRRLLEMLELSSQENSKLQESLHCSKEELQRLQCEVKLQRQQLSDSQHLLKSLRVELQVYEKIKTDAQKHNDSSETTQESASRPAGSLDLSELLSEIRHLRLQLERSIQTNTALRQRLEEQLLRGPNRSETININYLLSSPDEGGRSPGREGVDLRHSFQSYNEYTSVLHDEKRHARSEVGGGSLSSSSGDSSSSAPSRLVPGHRMWANRNGRHVLGLIEDFNALRKQISEGRKLSRGMDTQLQECLHNKVIEQQHVKSLSSSMNTMQQVLEEAGRLLKLVWRVSLPAAYTAGDSSNNQQDELLKNEISRLKSRLSQQERMLSGAVKRLRTTNQLKEGMERVIVDQRGPSQWPVGGTRDPDSSEDHYSDASLHCSF
ncbi:hypothetical protein F2P81_016197 [Scophthalmus maximus]|uniref:CDK5 regulatory subunit-associated protein 2/Myomegalin coiled coil domain-containing protein n=1 Tax=Scophthalmus maximus TaxID=52904 RepID=A0A6A4SMX5_SCOMX|nr:hypothetical protein F2P81_016197 [Scophthalmus maximus]